MSNKDLFLEMTDIEYDTTTAIDDAVLRERAAFINPAVLRSIRSTSIGLDPDLVLIFNAKLFEDANFECVLHQKSINIDYISFHGVASDIKESRIILIMSKSPDQRADFRTEISMSIYTGDKNFIVSPLEEDVYLVQEIDLAAPLACEEFENFSNERISLVNPEEKQVSKDDSNLKVRKAVPAEDDGKFQVIPGEYTVNLLVLYNSSVAKNDKAVRTTVPRLVEELQGILNSSMIGTEVTLKIELVGLMEMDIFGMANDYGNALDNLKNSKQVQKLREEKGADLVSLLRTIEGRSIAYCLSDAKGDPQTGFSVVNYAQAKARHSLAHEIGHNFGCPHNSENATVYGLNTQVKNAAGNKDGIGPHWGYHFFSSEEKRIRGTIMSYTGGDARILNFSNPLVYYKSDATGKETFNNARAIAKSAANISKYKKKILAL